MYNTTKKILSPERQIILPLYVIIILYLNGQSATEILESLLDMVPALTEKVVH